MAIWFHRPMPDLDGEEHVNDGNCWCNPMVFDNPIQALRAAKVLAQAAIASIEYAPEVEDDL